MSLPLTKEMAVGLCALLVGGIAVALDLSAPPRALPEPRVPPLERPTALREDELPVVAVRLRAEPVVLRGRNPFAAASVWEDPPPSPLGPPPERPRGLLLPLVRLGGGRARLPYAPEVPLPNKGGSR